MGSAVREQVELTKPLYFFILVSSRQSMKFKKSSMHYLLSDGVFLSEEQVYQDMSSASTWEHAEPTPPGNFLKSALITGYRFSAVTGGFLLRVSTEHGPRAWRERVSAWRR